MVLVPEPNGVRPAAPEQLDAVGAMLHDFNEEFGAPTPGPKVLASRMSDLLAGGDTAVLVAGEGPDALAVLRFRQAIWSEGLECYLAELYVAPDQRGRGLGRALMDGVIDEARRRGADTIDLGTDETDHVARHLYERVGFTNREGGADGPLMYVYELEL